MKTLIAAAALFVGILAAGPAHAGGDPAQEVIYSKHQIETFGDDTVDGNLAHPDGIRIDGTRRALAESLIRIRKSFRPELIKSLPR